MAPQTSADQEMQEIKTFFSVLGLDEVVARGRFFDEGNPTPPFQFRIVVSSSSDPFNE